MPRPWWCRFGLLKAPGVAAAGVRRGFDRGEGRRRWRGLDLGTLQVFLEADAPRVNCPAHGPTVIQVPWARHGVGHCRDFDHTVAWLATQCSKTAVVELMRIAWRMVGAIVARVSAVSSLSVHGAPAGEGGGG